MPRILSFHLNHSKEKENLFKSLLDTFISLDRSTKISVVTLTLIILATPFVVGNLQIFNPKAQKDETQQIRQQRPGQEKERKRVEKRLQTERHTNDIVVLAYNLKSHPENKDKVQQQLITASLERKKDLLALLELDPGQAKEHMLKDEVLSIVKDVPGIEVESKVSLSGTYSTLHRDDFTNPENTQYFNILIGNNKEYYLYSDKDFSKLEPNSSVTLEGYQLDDKVLVTSLTQSGNKVLGITDVLKPQEAQAATLGTLNTAVISTTFSDSTSPNP